MCVHREVEHRTRSYTKHKDVLRDIEYIWGCYPELRLGQLLCYIATEVLGTSDPFYLEDAKYQTFRDTVADRYDKI